MEILRTGDAVLIECEGAKTEGVVIFASSNGKSLMLGFDAVLHGHVGMMPVSRNDDGGYSSVITGIDVKVTFLTRGERKQ
jgi:hypothetical protein